MIPETHNELGAIKVPGYRAFAPQVNEIVETRIKSGKKLLSQLTENYAKIVEETTAAAGHSERQPAVSFA